MLEEKENMADFSEKWGTDVDTAVQLALADLKLTIDEVDVTVLEEPSRGFFGIGSKLALVRVEKKKKPEEKVQPQKADAPRKENTKKDIKKQVEKLLSHIGDYGFFIEYTKHDISHIEEMLKIVEWLIPGQTQDVMTPAEWMMLVLSIYFLLSKFWNFFC